MNVLFLYTVASLVASAECIAKFGVFLQELKPSQREAFRLIVKENLGKPKSQLRRDLDKFVLTVPTPLQELFNLQRQAIQHRSNTLKAAEKIQFLSPQAEVIFKQIVDYHDDNNLSVVSTLLKTRHLIEQTNQSLVNELEDLVSFQDVYSFF